MSTDPLPDSTPVRLIPKYSRYKSVRRAANAKKNADVNLENSSVIEVKRSESVLESQHKGMRDAIESDTVNTQHLGSVTPSSMQVHLQMGDGSSSSGINVEGVYARKFTVPLQPTQAAASVGEQSKGNEDDRAKRTRNHTLGHENESIESMQQGPAAEVQTRQAAEQEAEQKLRDTERLKAELKAATPIKAALSRKKFKLFTRSTKTVSKRSVIVSGQITAPIVSPGMTKYDTISVEETQALDPPQASVSLQKPVQVLEPSRLEIFDVIGQDGPETTPQNISSFSAFNSLERVRNKTDIDSLGCGANPHAVGSNRCRDSRINLPITSETTPLDLIRAAANLMTQDISVSLSILLESYDHLGLERRIRHYEHVRDIMNSWETDQQHSFVIRKWLGSPQYDHDLDLSHVPKLAPKDLTVYMYHSQGPGKWSKCYITLLSSGQIFISKKPDSKATDKGVLNICHLSNFDVYAPIPQRDQQMHSTIIDKDDFVHYFSTDDEKLAKKWYNTIQQWRSWYLVYLLGEYKDEQHKATERLPGGASSPAANEYVNMSVNNSLYNIETNQPITNSQITGSLIELGTVEDDFEKDTRPRQVPFHLRYDSGMPPGWGAGRYSPNLDVEPEVFAAGSLLGRSYTQRQRNQTNPERGSIAGPSFVQAPGTLFHRSAHGSLRHSVSLSSRSMERPETLGRMQRSSSQLQRPLVDLTPTFKEAPQWDKSKKGRGVKAPEGIPLVELTTGLQDSVLSGKPGTVFSREQNSMERL